MEINGAGASGGRINIDPNARVSVGVSDMNGQSESSQSERAKEIAHNVECYRQRMLPESVRIPEITGEMQLLRPVRYEDIEIMDHLNAWVGSSTITGLSSQGERAMIASWVRDSVAWSMGTRDPVSEVASAGLQRTIGWTMQTKLSDSIHPDDVRPIGMIFLTDIDGWTRSSRLQVILGSDFRGRGYSRDAMPRVMTYGFATVESGEGLGLHRIDTRVPEKNVRANSVYHSLGFSSEGVLADASWDDEENRYQNIYVLATMQDEYDPIRSLDAFGMRMIEGNPGTREALAAHQHSITIAKNPKLSTRHSGHRDRHGEGRSENDAEDVSDNDGDQHDTSAATRRRNDSVVDEYGVNTSEAQESQSHRHSKRAWWRRFNPSRYRKDHGSREDRSK